MSWPTTQDGLMHLSSQLMELIGGRKDVYAHYYDFADKKSGERVKGWAPVRGRRIAADYVLGEDEQETLNKRTGDRHLCDAFTAEALVKHISGVKRLGVYPIAKDETVRFLATDFDDHEGDLDPAEVWAEVKSFWDICEAQGIKAHIERSKSGTGYHVWTFFDGDVTAQKVRGVGRWLMEEASVLRDEEDFSTFDRFFPSQSFIAEGMIGNLIGLPMHGGWDYSKGLCAWVDPHSGDTIKDGPGYLSAILANGRMPASFIDEFISEDPDSIKLEERDTVKLQAKKERDPNDKLGTAVEAEQMFSRCEFIKWASGPDNQNDVKEPLWFSMLTNGARFDIDGRLHEASQHHKGYNSKHCQDKINHARTCGPAGCDVIRRDGFGGCPAGGCKRPDGQTVKSPAGLSAWVVANRRQEDVFDPMAGDYPEPESGDVIATDAQPAEQDEDKPLWKGDVPLDPDTGMPWPDVEGGWEISADGVFAPATPIKDKSGNIVDWRQGDMIAVRPIWVDAMATDNFGAWHVVFKFFDPDWNLVTSSLPDASLSDSAGKLAMILREMGAGFLSGKERMMCRMFDVMANGRTKRALISNKLGWYIKRNQCAFVLPDRVIGNNEAEIIFPKSFQNDMQCIRGEGQLRDWQLNVAKPCTGNPLLMFALMCSLAGPVLQFANVESGGFHFYGTTSKGKTTLHQVAASVWGEGSDPQEGGEHSFIRKWYATGNALEATAQLHNHLCLCIDEISQVESNELGDLIYMLAGGQPKGRSQGEGGLRRQQTWRMFFLSNGEKTITQIMKQANQSMKGGQRHRLPDIPIETADGQPLLIVEPHGKTHRQFAQDLKDASSTYFGTAGPTLASWMAAQAQKEGLQNFKAKIKSYVASMEANLLEDIQLPPDGARVVKRLAAAAVSGLLASEAMVLDWTPHKIHAAVVNIRNLWLEMLGEEKSEEDRALAHLRKMLLTSMHRFKDVDSQQMIPDMLGFRSDDYLMALTDTLYELVGEFDQKMVLRELKNKGLLWHEKDRLARKSPVIKGQKERPRVYFIRRSFLGEVDEAGVAGNDQFDYRG